MTKLSQEAHDKLCKELQNQGLFIEVGWRTLAWMLIPEDANANQLRDMRFAFFSGAQHLFAGIIGGLDDDKDPTEEDIKHMELIHNELAIFAKELLKGKKP